MHRRVAHVGVHQTRRDAIFLESRVDRCTLTQRGGCFRVERKRHAVAFHFFHACAVHVSLDTAARVEKQNRITLFDARSPL